MKTIIGKKLIIKINPDNTFDTGVIQYQINEDGIISNKFYTVCIDNGVTEGDVQDIVDNSISLAEQAEGIGE